MNIPGNHHPWFVIDTEGRRTAVILPVQEYEELLEDLAGLAVIAERRNEPSIPHEQVKAELARGSRDDDIPDTAR